MGNVKISELTSATSVGTTDEVPIVQSGTTKKATVGLLAGVRITDKTSETSVRVWDLDDGVYSLANGVNIKYNGASSSAGVVINSSSYLFVDSNSSYKYFYVLMGEGTSRYIYSGYTDASAGTYKAFNMGSNYQISNLVTSISGSSTDTKYPSAKCVYDNLALKQNKVTYSMTDLTPGVSTLNDGELYFVYE